jgi:hypothetical protein
MLKRSQAWDPRALSKLERNADRDRDDVLRLARAGLVDAQTLKARYDESCVRICSAERVGMTKLLICGLK